LRIAIFISLINDSGRKGARATFGVRRFALGELG
jgi:hypothetical protein